MTGTVTQSETAPFHRRRRLRRAGAAYDPLDAVMQSVVAILRETTGLLRNVAELGIALALNAGSTAPKRRPLTRPLPAPSAANIIRFPTNRNTQARK